MTTRRHRRSYEQQAMDIVRFGLERELRKLETKAARLKAEWQQAEAAAEKSRRQLATLMEQDASKRVVYVPRPMSEWTDAPEPAQDARIAPAETAAWPPIAPAETAAVSTEAASPWHPIVPPDVPAWRK